MEGASMLKARFGKSEKWHVFRTMAEAEKYAEAAGAKVIRFAHDPVPLVRIREEWVWMTA